MPVQFYLNVMKSGNVLRITIPKEISQYLDLKKGDQVSMWVDDHHIVMEKREKTE